MVSQKRKRTEELDENSDASDYSIVQASSDDEVDISSALAGKKSRTDGPPDPVEEDDEDLEKFIQTSIAKRNVKGGTDIIKKTKGKSKIAKGEVGGGSFQSMGLHPSLLRSLTLQGYRIPTPIQRTSIPTLLANPPRDLVGMARTGSGKTLAYMIPLVQRLSGRHASTFGARALILLPARELALQVLKVGKELARGWNGKEGAHAGDNQGETSEKGQALRWGLIVGGEGLDEQFEMITNNPDVIIATPGRLLHLIVEMNLDLKSVQYVVFDEADRLFEMGFETALNEILHRLPSSRQTLLFSATLPKSLVDFAKAGLQDPKLVRLDAESKISSDLKMAFFSIKQAEKDACLLALLRDVIRVPFGSSAPKEGTDGDDATKPRRDKGKQRATQTTTAPHQTLIFAATKHHVEYLSNLLSAAGYAVSHIYGALDQSARTYQMDQFRRGYTSVLVVTDVAARGIDIPVLENVVNYDFPHGARVFVHRVGRTARAGRQGWAWSFVTHTELPYLLDLQLFLGRPLTSQVSAGSGDDAFTESLVLGNFSRERIDEDVEYVRSLDAAQHQLPVLREVMRRGHAMYERSKGKASQASYKRAKDMSKDTQWALAGAIEAGIHPVILHRTGGGAKMAEEDARKKLMKVVNSFKPAETVFEIGTRGKASTANAALMKERRKALKKAAERSVLPSTATADAEVEEDDDSNEDELPHENMEMADEDEIAAVFNTSSKKSGKGSYRDEEFYMSHYQKDASTEKGYSLTDGASSFAEQARGATFDLAGDEGVAARQRHKMTWDKKKKKFIKGDGVGADNVKLVRTESGTKLPATYRSGRFDEWKAKSHVSLPKIGEAEPERRGSGFGPGGRKFKHQKVVSAKPLDKLGKDYERKVRQIKKREENNPQEGGFSKMKGDPKRAKQKAKTSGGRYGGKSMGRVKSEIKTVDQIRKTRQTAERKKARNARPSRKGKR
ncbi:P-loop containing nucleoside triphosphate hydrolase protein [Hygrophoropsis aurantiaca]|uniref:P-loop containing nucleoside triphosphate hydrolase protein n=1 Tax=Hygrophoropsis aurantiaca TaxID=72124 RepID=A0ACB8AL03_9AGAM|nr:P-loop containing nucleoside triphosphate hydrolase protein [Hygrophoropsis aurantiaca]